MRNIKLFSLKWSLSEWCFMHCYTIYYGQWTFFANVTSTLGTKKIVCPCSQEICIMPAAQNPWTAAIVDKTGHFVLEVAFSNISSTAKVSRDPDWNPVLEWASGYSALALRCTHGRRWTRVFARLTADSCSAMSGSEIQIWGSERHPEHLITTPLNRVEPIQTEQMGHAVELQTGRASPSPPPSAPLIQTQTDTS